MTLLLNRFTLWSTGSQDLKHTIGGCRQNSNPSSGIFVNYFLITEYIFLNSYLKNWKITLNNIGREIHWKDNEYLKELSGSFRKTCTDRYMAEARSLRRRHKKLYEDRTRDNIRSCDSSAATECWIPAPPSTILLPFDSLHCCLSKPEPPCCCFFTSLASHLNFWFSELMAKSRYCTYALAFWEKHFISYSRSWALLSTKHTYCGILEMCK